MTTKNAFSVFLILTLFLYFPGRMNAQNTGDVPEVGIVEHLGSTIPLDLTFTTEDGRKILLKDVITKPTILALVYFDCPGVCPQILSSLSNVVEEMTMGLGKEYRVVTVSFNSNDTPITALDKKQQFLPTGNNIQSGDWFFLTGDSTNIRSLTNAVGFMFKQTGNDFTHPACIMVLSPTGKITRYLYGTVFLPFDVKLALVEAQRGQSRPTINKVLDFCYSYDPAGRRYSLEVTKVSGIIILFFAVLLLGGLIIRSRMKRTGKNEKGI